MSLVIDFKMFRNMKRLQYLFSFTIAFENLVIAAFFKCYQVLYTDIMATGNIKKMYHANNSAEISVLENIFLLEFLKFC